MKTKWRLGVAVGVGLMTLIIGRAEAGTGTIDGTITVTPLATVMLQLSPTYYSYGTLPVGVGQSSITANFLTLSNTGQVNVTMQKQVTAGGGWTPSTAVSTDTFVLWVTTANAMPAAAEFTAATQFGALSNNTNLTAAGGTQITLTTDATLPSVKLWFKLDMPTQVTTSSSRLISVRFTGTGQ